MFCPKCSQPQVSDETQFCSRCGLPLNNLKEMILSKGETNVKSDADENTLSPRQKGVRQGVMLMLLSVILIPAYVLLAALFPASDHLVESSVSDTPFEKISQTVLLTIFMVGLVRVLYARFFQQGETPCAGEPDGTQLAGSSSTYTLPPAQGISVSGFGSWRANTGEIVKSPSITEPTTKSFNGE